MSQVFSLSEKKVKNMQSKDYKEPCVEFPAFRWFGLYGSTAGGTGLIPVQETKIPPCPVAQLGKKTTQTHVHCVGDAIQPSHSLSSPSPPAFSLAQHQGLFQ